MNTKHIVSGIALVAVVTMVSAALLPILDASAWYSSTTNNQQTYNSGGDPYQYYNQANGNFAYNQQANTGAIGNVQQGAQSCAVGCFN